MAEAVLQAGQPGVISGSPDDSSLVGTPFGVSEAEAQRIAREICDQHRTGKENKRARDLTAEKYAAHADGEGDAQWADIVNGSEVRIPTNLSGGLRWSWNVLRPLIANHVSYHTQIPMRVVARPASDRRSREKAIIDQIWANHTLECQRMNERAGNALAIADVYGMCPLHAQWRYDISYDAIEPVFDRGGQGPGMQPGHVDYFEGDPWDTVLFESAKPGFIPGLTYGRVIATDLVRQAFAHLGDNIVKKIEGRKDLPASARMQRILRRWMASGLIAYRTSSGGRVERILRQRTELKLTDAQVNQLEAMRKEDVTRRQNYMRALIDLESRAAAGQMGAVDLRTQSRELRAAAEDDAARTREQVERILTVEQRDQIDRERMTGMRWREVPPATPRARAVPYLPLPRVAPAPPSRRYELRPFDAPRSRPVPRVIPPRPPRLDEYGRPYLREEAVRRRIEELRRRREGIS